jgi:methyltransferase
MYFILFISFVILQRLLELLVAKGNEKWSRNHGAVEYGQKHYPYIVLLHTLFIASMIVEYFCKSGSFNFIVMLAFLLLIVLKVWVISSLGKYWNTKILRIPNSSFIKNGPYKLFKHPNYFIVICEIIAIPMVFNLYITAIIFTILNALMLTVRIREEEKVWSSIS